MYRHSIRLFLAAVGTATMATAMDPGMPVAARVRIVPSETQIVPSEEPMDHYVPEGWSEEESYLLMKIAMSEAEGEDTKGKALVMCVVLNRVESIQFPDTIYDVIFDDGAFTSVTNGRYDRVEPDTDCYAALDLVKDGWDGTDGALYFERTTDEETWHSRNLDKLFSYGNHTFYIERGDDE